MIVEAALLSATASLLGCLRFARWAVERVDEEEIRPYVRPYQKLFVGTPCILCGILASNSPIDGPGVAHICKETRCRKTREHLRVFCRTCTGGWCMDTAETAKKAKKATT